MNQLRNWIQDCSNKHKGCLPLTGTSELPTRVIEILGPETVRLKENTSEEAPYTCLSHCWGVDDWYKPKLIQTNARTISAFRESIPWGDLPKTFQDAIAVSHQLGISYVWIDSLCILQVRSAQSFIQAAKVLTRTKGDTEDWLREGSRMCDIYSKAYLTIAATRARGPTEGCFATRERLPGIVHEFKSPKREVYKVYVCEPQERLLHINDFEQSYEAKDCFPLLQRAWAFQERLLSPRVVHFGPSELLWECQEVKTCECSNWPGYSRSAEGPSFEKPYMTMDSVPTEFAGNAIQSPLDWKWRRIVEHYTTKSLTYPADIFPALQGVASYVQHGREYCAGLWNDDSLIPNLLWRVRDRVRALNYKIHARQAMLTVEELKRCLAQPRWIPKTRKAHVASRPWAWRAPTWSWASVAEPIIFDAQINDATRRLISVVSIHTVPVGLDPLGQLKSGHLQLKGRCVDAQIYPYGRVSSGSTTNSAQLLIRWRANETFLWRAPMVPREHKNKGVAPKQLKSDTASIPESAAASADSPSDPDSPLDPRWPAISATDDKRTNSQHNNTEYKSLNIDYEDRDVEYDSYYYNHDTSLRGGEAFHMDYNVPFNGQVVRMMEALQWQKRERLDGYSWDMFSYLGFVCVDEAKSIYERVGCFHTSQRFDAELFVDGGKELNILVV